MHDYVAGTDRARQRHQVADFGDILPPCRPPRVHLALSTKFQNLQFPFLISFLFRPKSISFLLKFNRYISFLSAKMSLLFLRTTISKLRRKIYDTSIKDALRLSTIVFEYLKEGLIGEISTEITIMVELIHGRVKERERGSGNIENSRVVRTQWLRRVCGTQKWCAWNVSVTHWADVRARRITPRGDDPKSIVCDLEGWLIPNHVYRPPLGDLWNVVSRPLSHHPIVTNYSRNEC